MKKLISLVLLITVALTLVFTGLSCASTNASTPTPTDTTTTTPPPKETQVPFLKLVEDFIKNSSTFKFDGIDGSLMLVRAEEYSPISVFRAMEFTYQYQTRHPGHGDRSGQMLAQVITYHTAVIWVDVDRKEVRMAVCDEEWNMIEDQKVLPVPTTVSGIVIGGGDVNVADGPQDAPRTYIYTIGKKDGALVYVSYTAYPPSPVGDANRAKITLDFYSGAIEAGDFMEARGILDKASQTLVVANEGDYIRTSMPRLEVVGVVVSGGDTTPEGLMDAPRTFVYKLEKDNHTFVNVSYTAYPPSLVGEANRKKITLSFYDESGIKVGDYMKAFGNFDKDTNTILVANEGDFIKTYPVKP